MDIPPVKQLSRRHFLSLVGGGTVIAATSGLGVFAATRTPHDALAPWSLAGTYKEPRRFALSYAILAPNPHNLQPWLVDLREEGVVTLLPDPTRRLPITDPFDRQLTIGLGCFLEQMKIAASANGFSVETKLFPEGTSDDLLGDRPIARVQFTPSEIVKEPLFATLLQRRSVKTPFDMKRPVNANTLQSLDPELREISFHGTTDPNRVTELRQLTWDAWLTEYSTPSAHQESVDLMRLGKNEINTTPDGIDLRGMPIEGLIALGFVTQKGLAKQGSYSYEAGKDMYRKILDSTPAFVWLTSADNSRFTQIDVGRAWLRLNLLTTQQGMALHPVSQCLQEYPEMENRYIAAHKKLATPGRTVQMLGRLGYADPAPQSPRWSLDDKIRYRG